MRSLILHLAADLLWYVIRVLLILGLIGIVNRLLRKPFFDGWRRTLSFVTLWVVAGWVFDLIPAKLHLVTAVAGGLILLVWFVWFCLKHPGRPSIRL